MIIYLPLPVRFRLPFYTFLVLLVFFYFHSKNFPGGNDDPLAFICLGNSLSLPCFWSSPSMGVKFVVDNYFLSIL